MKYIQHRTSNIEHPMFSRLPRRWVLNVGCWLLVVPKAILMFAIRVYQLAISPAQIFLFGPAGGCRFTPTCSQYAMDAFQEHGVLAGGALAAKRICRCHPWGGCGHDPVPGKAEREGRKTATGIVWKNAH